MNRPKWNKDKTVLTYKTEEGDWLKETYNRDLNLIKRTTSWGEWTEHEYVEKGKAKGRIAVIRNSNGLVKTFVYEESGRINSKKGKEERI
jgi:hypothetical protein